MTNVDFGIRIKELANEVKDLSIEMASLSKGIGINDLWDNTDIIRNWKVSSRTLATWRAEGLIGYVQVASKIWYPREARELFLNNYYVETKNGGER